MHGLEAFEPWTGRVPTSLKLLLLRVFRQLRAQWPPLQSRSWPFWRVGILLRDVFRYSAIESSISLSCKRCIFQTFLVVVICLSGHIDIKILGGGKHDWVICNLLGFLNKRWDSLLFRQGTWTLSLHALFLHVSVFILLLLFLWHFLGLLFLQFGNWLNEHVINCGFFWLRSTNDLSLIHCLIRVLCWLNVLIGGFAIEFRKLFFVENYRFWHWHDHPLRHFF